MSLEDCYRILGVERTASANQIKQAYRKLVHKYHPDISADSRSEEKFKQVVAAYQMLKNSAGRARCTKPNIQTEKNGQAKKNGQTKNKQAPHVDIFV